MDTIKLGNKVRDTVTGFSGIVTSRIEYLNGCIQFGVGGKVRKDGGVPGTEYFDWQRLEMLGPGLAPKMSRTGGPQRDAPGHGEYRG